MTHSGVLPERLVADLGPTLELATLLTGSGRGAAELLADTLTRDRSWSETDDGYDLTPRLRVAVVRAYLGSPLGRSRPPRSAAGLDALPGPLRAAVVLRDAEGLTLGEIAGILDRPVNRLVGELGGQVAVHDDEIARLRTLAPSTQDLSATYATAARQARRTRRRRTGLVSVAAVLAAVVIAVPTAVLPRIPVGVREPGTWRYSHELRLADGWKLVVRSIEAETETTVVEVPRTGADPVECSIKVSVRGAEVDRSGNAEPVSIRTRPGEILHGPGSAVRLIWEYATGAWASAECESPAADDRALVIALASAVRFRDSRQLLPFQLTRLPEGYRINTVGEAFLPMWGSADVWGPTVLLEPPADSYRPGVFLGPDLSGTADDLSTASVRCLGPGDTVCVSTFGTDDQMPPNRGLLRFTLSQAVECVRLADDPADRSTWFDAVGLPAT